MLLGAIRAWYGPLSSHGWRWRVFDCRLLAPYFLSGYYYVQPSVRGPRIRHGVGHHVWPTFVLGVFVLLRTGPPHHEDRNGYLFLAVVAHVKGPSHGNMLVADSHTLQSDSSLIDCVKAPLVVFMNTNGCHPSDERLELCK